jgi:predicted Zn-dependent protease
MYLYHHPDIWYDYAMWHAKNGSVDSAAKIFQRALKAIPGNKIFSRVQFFFLENAGELRFIILRRLKWG